MKAVVIVVLPTPLDTPARTILGIATAFNSPLLSVLKIVMFEMQAQVFELLIVLFRLRPPAQQQVRLQATICSISNLPLASDTFGSDASSGG